MCVFESEQLIDVIEGCLVVIRRSAAEATDTLTEGVRRTNNKYVLVWQKEMKGYWQSR